MRVNDGSASCGVPRQTVSIDPTTAVEGVRIIINRLVIDDRSPSRSGDHRRGPERAVIRDIIIDSCDRWRSSGSNCHHARKGIRGFGTGGGGVVDTILQKVSERRIGVKSDIAREIDRVHSVDAQHEYSLGQGWVCGLTL